MIETIGLKLKGWYDENGTYHMTDEEIKQEEQGQLVVVGCTIYSSGFKTHDYRIISIKEVERISIFYDIEDDYCMSQTFYLKNGEKVWGMSRNHTQVSCWEAMGIPIEKTEGVG